MATEPAALAPAAPGRGAAASGTRGTPRSGRGGGLLTTVLLLPAALWYTLLLIAPLVIVVIFSFGVRARNGGYAPALVLDNYARAIQKSEPFILSLEMAILGTIGCLLVALPL